MDFKNIVSLLIQEGNVDKITNNNGTVLWERTYDYALISTGIQVIDTGVYCSENMSCEIKMSWMEFPSNATYIGAIEYNNGSYKRCHFQCAKSGTSQIIGFWQDSPTVGNAVSIPFDTKPHILTYSAQNLTVGIDGVVASHGNTPPTNSTFYLFDRNVVGFTANAEAGKCKVYYAKFWENGQLIRDFIPLLDSNGKMALFDLVHRKFYYDLNGNNFTYETKQRNGGDE